jgi:hypothetical protein
MHRRSIVAAAIGGIAALAPPFTAAAHSATANVDDLAAALAEARAALDASRLTALTDALPAWLDTAAAIRDRVRGEAWIRATGLHARLLAAAAHAAYRTSHDAAATTTAREAAELADAADNPLARAEAARVAAVLRRRGGDAGATGAMMAAADDLERATGLDDARALAIWAETICSAAYTAVGFGSLTDADGLLEEARAALWAAGAPTMFTVNDVAVFEASAAMRAGAYDLVLDRADAVDLIQVSNGHQRAHYWKNLAIAAAACGEAGRSVRALEEIHRATPDFLAFHPWATELAGELAASREGGDSDLVRSLISAQENHRSNKT